MGQRIASSREGYREGRGKIKNIMKAFFKLLQYEPKNKIIGINVNHTDMNVIFSKHLSVHLNAHITGISYGYWIPKKGPRIKSQKDTKRKAIFAARYFVTRYLFDYSDRIREFVLGIVK
jgi:hypothetical protein